MTGIHQDVVILTVRVTAVTVGKIKPPLASAGGGFFASMLRCWLPL